MPDVVGALGIVITSIFFFWTLYHVPLVVVGLKRFFNEGDNTNNNLKGSSHRWPKVSIIVPVKNEEKVVERLLKALVSLTYPNKEVIVVEDGSTDRTGEICKEFAERYPLIIRYYHRDVSEGKPSAINFAAKRATGEIIAIYDADTIVEPDVLEKILPHFDDPKVAVVQGQVYTINPKQSPWARVSALNDFVLHIAQLGKNRLGLFVVCQGNHMYFRRGVLEELGFWDPQALAEDVEISVRLMKRGYKVKYVTVRAGIEAPSELKGLLKQRLRWFRGYLQTLGKHRDISWPSSVKELDALVTLLTPVFLVLSLPGFVFGLWYVTSYLGQTFGLVLLLVSVLGPNAIALARPKSFVYIPLLYLNWVVQALAGTYACVHALLRRRMSWIKTEKGGVVTEVDYSIISGRKGVN
jgi:cellulose synthase/poly-beta-1,6-N-acetylglucosamine synthase-like glycosyltransferase